MTNEQKQLKDIETLTNQRNRWALKYQELEAVMDERIAAAVQAEREHYNAALNAIYTIASCAPNDDSELAGQEFERIMNNAKSAIRGK